MKVALLEAKCATCSTVHSRPELGDFAYGQFIFTGTLGTVHAYVEAPGPVWSVLESALPQPIGQHQRAELLQTAYAYFADPIGGQQLVNHFVCPKCQSSSAVYWGGDKTGETDVALVSFNAFVSLPLSEQQSRARAFYVKAQQGIQPDGPASGGSAG